jgi:hypothetical protein
MYNCCNAYGTCPENYATWYGSHYTSCYYYYGSESSSVGTIVGAVIGSIALTAILLIAFRCYRHYKQQGINQDPFASAKGNEGNKGDNKLIIVPPSNYG